MPLSRCSPASARSSAVRLGMTESWADAESDSEDMYESKYEERPALPSAGDRDGLHRDINDNRAGAEQLATAGTALSVAPDHPVALEAAAADSASSVSHGTAALEAAVDSASSLDTVYSQEGHPNEEVKESLTAGQPEDGVVSPPLL